MTAQSDVLAVVDENWRNARAIHARVECWGFTTIRHNLNILSNDGAIEKRMLPNKSGWVSEYRMARKEAKP